MLDNSKNVVADELFDYVGQTKYYGISYYNDLDDDYDKNKDDDFAFSF